MKCVLFVSDNSTLIIFKFHNHQLQAKCQNNRKGKHQRYHLSISKLHLLITKSKIQLQYFVSEIKVRNLSNKYTPTLWETCFRLILEHISCALEERDGVNMRMLIWSSIPHFKGHKSMSNSSIFFRLAYKEITLVSDIKSFHFEQ